MKLTVIIPVYNEQATITKLIDKVKAVKLNGLTKEIIVVDDGSTDKSGHLIQKATAKYSGVTSFSLPINLGKGAAIRLGLKHASGDIIIIQDGDLELDPQEFHQILEPILNKQSKIVYGSRVLAGKKIPFKSYLATKITSTLVGLFFGHWITDINTAYKAFTREVLNKLTLRSVQFEFDAEFTVKALKLGYKIKEVPVSYNPRTKLEGKKIRFHDGLDLVFTILKFRFVQ
jgi:dolichol-phosphate mannosyltransferase